MGYCPLLKNPTPALGLRPFGLDPNNNPGHALDVRLNAGTYKYKYQH